MDQVRDVARPDSGPALDADVGSPWMVRESAAEYGPEREPGNADPFSDDAEELDALGWRIISISAEMEAADYRRMVAIAEFDRRGGWKRAGHRDCADWLHFNVGMARATAREKVRTARALGRLPLTSRAMALGELSFSKARAVSRLVDDIGVSAETAGRIAAAGDILEVDLAGVAGLDPESGEIVDPDSELAADAVVSEDGETLIAPEAEILSYARECTVSELEKLVRSWRLVRGVDEQEQERRRHASRYFSMGPDGDGMYVLRGRVDPEVGALLMRAVEAADDALYRKGPDGRATDWAPEGGLRGPKTREFAARQRRADALGLLAERAMELGFGVIDEEDAEDFDEDCEEEAAEAKEEAEVVGEETAEPEAGRAELEACSGEPEAGSADPETGSPCTCDGHPVPGGPLTKRPGPISGTRAQRYQVTLHVDMETLRGGSEREGPGGDGDRRSRLEDGTRVSCETARRLCCDAAIVTALRSMDGSLLDIGRRTRKVPPALRRALEIRDGGCRWPGCGLRFVVPHHIEYWALGGHTKLSNLISLCRMHHRCVHEEGFKVKLRADGTALFWDRTGWPLPNRPPPSRAGPGALERLIAANRGHGLEPDPSSLQADYRRSSDIPWDRWARTWEALDR